MNEQKITELQQQIEELQKEVEIIDEQVYHLEDQIDIKKRELKELTRQKMLGDMQDIQKYIEQLEQKPNMRWDSFDITFSKEEVAKILRFQEETENKYSGAIGGTYKYEVIPTSIGLIITITDGEREATIRELD